MKKMFLTGLIVFSLMFTTAQTTKFGIKAGLGLPEISNDFDLKSKVGFQLGGFVEIKVLDKIIIQPELLYTKVGSEYEDVFFVGGLGIVKSNNDINLSYILLPVMLKFYANDKISFETGPQIGFLVNAKRKQSFVSGNTRNNTYDLKEEMKSTVFGINLGGAYDISKKISLCIRYTIGLSRFQKKPEVGILSNSKNFLLQLNFSYKI